jgi:integrase
MATVDFESGVVRVRRQLDRSREYVEPKTEQAKRDVVLAPAFGRLLREHRLAARYSADSDPVFANANGRPFEHRTVLSRGFDTAANQARLNGPGRRKAVFHDCRNTFASLLIAQGADVVFVSRQLGHADPAITLRVYADEFAKRDHAERTRALLDAAVGTSLETIGGEPRQIAPTATEAEAGAKVADMQGIGDQRRPAANQTG